MAWANSKVFQRYLTNMVGNVLALDYDSDTIKAALYNNSITPDNDVATDVLTGYNGAASQWVTANEVIDSSGGGTDWPAGGVALGTKSLDVATADLVKVLAANTASGGTADIANAYGCLVYDDTLANKPGMSYNYFGGPNSVTAGTFTIVWHANGVISFTL
jgi:hypothetical protein